MEKKSWKIKGKTLVIRWYSNLRIFLKHPVQTTKDYFRSFKTLSKGEKIKKIVTAAMFAAVTVYAFWLVIAVCAALLLSAAILASGGIELRRVEHARHMAEEYGGTEINYL